MDPRDPGVPLLLVLDHRPLGGERLDLGLVDDVLRQALASQWAARLILLRATAFPLGRGLLAFADDLRIVAGNDVAEVGQGPVGDLHCLPVEGLVARVTRREALVQDLQKLPADVGTDGSAPGRVEPVHFPCSPPPPSRPRLPSPPFPRHQDLAEKGSHPFRL